MEKESNSWFPYQQFELPPSYSNMSEQLPALMNPYRKDACSNQAFPMNPFSGMPMPISEANQPIEHYNLFYCAPRLRQTFPPPLAKEKLVSDQMDNYGVNGSANVASNNIGKQFLVFDKSGDQTSLIYSSGIRSPPLGCCLNSWNPKPYTRFDVIKEEMLLKENVKNPKVLPFLNFEGNNNQEYPEDGLEEMHEDTEELNALLYSDDDEDNGYSEDDDVTSTGHSPSTMTDHGIHRIEIDEDEVASNACSIKRRKLFDGAYDVPPLVHVVSKPFKLSELEDDAESYCGNYDNQDSGDSYVSVSGKKRSRTEKIRAKLSILQNIIPGTKGKNPTVIIDEAVQYLKFLKDKAKSFGLDSP